MSNTEWSSATDDQTLIEYCLKGQEDAWKALITKDERLICATCHRYNLQAVEGEDVFGRVCLLLLRHIDQLKDQSRLSSWLITTTSRECWHCKAKRLPTSNAKPLISRENKIRKNATIKS
jgi:DNA-directed RNA polymerase specialized sigma24 family protein